MPRALFLDRDGVINVDRGYVGGRENFEFLDGVFPLGRQARALGVELIVVTNQSGIARGLYTEEDFAALTSWMTDRFRAEGAPLAAVHHCPHHPTEGIGDLHRECTCRKPAPGLVLGAARTRNLDLAASAMLGDKPTDMDCARRAGVGLRLFLGDARHAPSDAHPCSSHAVAGCALASFVSAGFPRR